jgi:hypothetical protein
MKYTFCLLPIIKLLMERMSSAVSKTYGQETLYALVTQRFVMDDQRCFTSTLSYTFGWVGKIALCAPIRTLRLLFSIILMLTSSYAVGLVEKAFAGSKFRVYLLFIAMIQKTTVTKIERRLTNAIPPLKEVFEYIVLQLIGSLRKILQCTE